MYLFPGLESIVLSRVESEELKRDLSHPCRRCVELVCDAKQALEQSGLPTPSLRQSAKQSAPVAHLVLAIADILGFDGLPTKPELSMALYNFFFHSKPRLPVGQSYTTH